MVGADTHVSTKGFSGNIRCCRPRSGPDEIGPAIHCWDRVVLRGEVRKTDDRVPNRQNISSTVSFADSDSVSVLLSAVNCWVIIERLLCGLINLLFWQAPGLQLNVARSKLSPNRVGTCACLFDPSADGLSEIAA
jgi:hypothetical protein